MQNPSLRWRLAQYLESRWWRRYLKDKTPTDYLADKRAYWARTLEQLDWRPVPGRRVLDAGCGPAGIFLLVGATERVTAVDPLLETYERELAIFDRTDHPEVSFRTAALEQADLGVGEYAAIYCFNAINHVSDWRAALAALGRAVEPGGRMILTSDVHRHAWLLPVFRALPGDALHPQQHGAANYRRALAAGGWEIEREVVLRREAIFDYTAWVVRKTGGTAR